MHTTPNQNQEDRKGGAVPPWMTGTARVGSGGFGTGSAQLANSSMMKLFTVLLGPKVLVAATVLGGVALGMGIVSTIQEPQQPSLSQRFDMAKVKTEAPSGMLPGMEKPGETALNMAQQANSGFYSAGDQPPAPDESKSDPKVDAPADPAVAAGAQASQGGVAGDPAAMAAALTAKQGSKAKMGRPFGKLSNGMGGGALLTGGAGLSGGIGTPFRQTNLMNARAGELRGMQGANRAQMTRVPLSSNNLGRSAFKGANAKRLDNMNRAMGAVRSADAEAASSVHTQQWDAAQPTGNGITGAGIGGMSHGQFSSDEGAGTGNPVNNGSPSGPTSAAPVQDINNGTNQTPYQGQLDMAKGMLVLASAIVTVIGALAMMDYAPIVGTAAAALQTILFGVATALAAAATFTGLSIQKKYGQGMQGSMIAMGGSITTAFSIAAMVAPTEIPAWTAVVAGIAGMAAGIFGGAGGSGKLQDHSNVSNG